MPDTKREDAELRIGAVLLAEWDPMDVKADPSHSTEYMPFAHEIYGLLIRGGSDVQVGRLLHQIEREQMHHPEADSRDLTAVLKTLRALEKTI
jgi:hypothetical protein